MRHFCLKSSVATAALLAAFPGIVQAGAIESGKAAKVTMSGHFNKVFTWADNGSASRATVADNSVSQSRFRIIADMPVSEEVSVQGRLEAAFNSNQLSSIGIVDGNSNLSETSAVDTDGGASADATVRHSYIRFMHKQFGSLTIGASPEATDGIYLQNFNPAGHLIDPDTFISGGIQVQEDNAADNVFSGLTVSNFLTTFDGGNTDNIGYRTPNIGGFVGAVSFADNQEVGASLKFGGKFSGFAVKAGVGYEHRSGSSATVDSVLFASGGIRHDSGISVDFGIGAEDGATSTSVEGEAYYIIVGYEADIFAGGSTGFAAMYNNSEDSTVNGDEGDRYNFSVQQGLAPGLDVYAGIDYVEPDRPGTDYEDVVMFVVGSKLLF